MSRMLLPGNVKYENFYAFFTMHAGIWGEPDAEFMSPAAVKDKTIVGKTKTKRCLDNSLRRTKRRDAQLALSSMHRFLFYDFLMRATNTIHQIKSKLRAEINARCIGLHNFEWKIIS